MQIERFAGSTPKTHSILQARVEGLQRLTSAGHCASPEVRPASEVHRISAARFAAGFRLAYRRSELDGIAALPATPAARGHSGRWRERVRSSMNRSTNLGPPDRHRIARVPKRAPGSGAPSE